MYELKIFQFHELNSEAQAKALDSMARVHYDGLREHGFSKLSNRKPAVNKIRALMKEAVSAQYLESGLPVSLPVRGPAKPASMRNALDS